MLVAWSLYYRPRTRVADVPAEDALPAAGAEVPGVGGGREGHGGAALSAQPADAAQIQHTEGPPTQLVSVCACVCVRVHENAQIQHTEGPPTQLVSVCACVCS